MLAVLGGAALIGDGDRVADGCLRGGFDDFWGDVLADQGRFCRLGPNWSWGDGAEADARGAATIARAECDDAADADDGDVHLLAGREPLIRAAGARGGRRDEDLGNELIRLEHGTAGANEEVFHRHA